MTSSSPLVDTVAVLLLQNVREGMETGRIANIETAQTEIESAIAQLSRRRLLDEPTHINDLVAKLLLEVGSLQEKVAKCESQITEFHSRAEILEEETTHIGASTEACTSLVEQQQRENVKVLAALESVKANINISTAPPACLAPAPSPTDLVARPVPSRMAIVSFPGGPRTITIHPPGSPNYQSTIRDEDGDIIVTLKATTKPLRREGAFRGPLEEIDLAEIHRVCGRGPEISGSRAVPPVPRWPDRSQPSRSSPPGSPSNIIARQRQLTFSMQTDAFGRVLAPDYLIHAKSPSLPTGMSFFSSQGLPSSSSSRPEITTTPSSTPSSHFIRRGKKRARHSEDDEGVPLTTETRKDVPQPTDPFKTPTKHEVSHPPEGRTKRKKFRSSVSVDAMRVGSLSRTHSLLDVTRTI